MLWKRIHGTLPCKFEALFGASDSRLTGFRRSMIHGSIRCRDFHYAVIGERNVHPAASHRAVASAASADRLPVMEYRVLCLRTSFH